MSLPDLQSVAVAVLHRARNQGYILPREIRMELKEAGHPQQVWKQVVNLIRPSLKYHHGRYYFKLAPVSLLQREEDQLRHIRDTLQRFLQKQQKKQAADRQRGGRNSAVCPLKIRTENGQELTVLGQDLSSSGFRVITDRSLLGRKILLFLPAGNNGGSSFPVVISARVLWSVEIADGLFKNGGSFMELICPEPN